MSTTLPVVMFVRNAWYPVAWEREIGESPLAVRALGERIVVYRSGPERYAAMVDRCPHRQLPLSMGRVIGDLIECGYHGLCFDEQGACVKAPTNGTIPSRAETRPFAAQARYGLVWLWMGDINDADPATIFGVDHWDDPAWGTTVGDDMVVDCNYLSIVDNLLDPSHVAWVHRSSFAGQGSDDTPMETTLAPDGVTTWRWMMDTEPAPFYAPYLGFTGSCDRKQQYEVRFPSHALVRSVITPCGAGGEGRATHPKTFLMDSYNFLTPIDERSTRYFWFQQRNVMVDDTDVSVAFAASVRAAFEEDKVILTAIQQAADETPPETVLNLRSDVGGLRFRHRIAQLVDAEQASSSGYE